MSDITRALELLDAAAADVSASSELTFERIRGAQKLIRTALAKREAVAVPEHINECARQDAWNRGYGAGWNDCIDRVRKLNAAASQQAKDGSP